MADKYSIEDLITMSLNDSPADMLDAFDDLMSGRIEERIDGVRRDVIANMFGVEPIEDDAPEDEELEAEDYDDVPTEDESGGDDEAKEE